MGTPLIFAGRPFRKSGFRNMEYETWQLHMTLRRSKFSSEMAFNEQVPTQSGHSIPQILTIISKLTKASCE